ncbi:IS1182 family transposase [Rhodoblastus acidophilus]|uniref:IS1182 family transposase n=1 Tax=Candidatus Rhodoblastus alkanivorans TaxID=2954117 RepID=A0ABS9Z223_9HYPH|nr:IS1182 family transposase [Candidatus Rhodoblastus alkanivorans]MCI4679031.1 IS1182 family transposase [Candidatus Rhodoblastus alkanivorans]MCI4681714.1 IS1182 family transposase [Candidatus Rhodoblastus alkanivorans]MDI4642762.1 IS1182 family transposase [Rhodoblastus acidophilus]
MSRTFRPSKIDQTQLLPAGVADYVPAGHLSRFVVALARESLDLSEINSVYKSALGQPPFDPRMVTALLLYAYCSGLYSSRRIARACGERVDFMMIRAHDAPDFRTIADFRKRHLAALANLFLQVLKLAEKAGLAKLGHVALDGTKIKANASKHKAMSYERMKTREAELGAEVDRWLAAAEAADAQEDALHGASRRGDEMPDWVADKQKRLAKIREARQALEEEAAAEAKAKAEAERAAEEKRKADNRKRSGPRPRPPSNEPAPKAQRNFTDPNSRVLLTKDGFVQGYNAQATVDGTAQIIVAHGLTQSMSDWPQLVPMVDRVCANLGRKSKEVSADAGYCSEGNLFALASRKIQAYVATGRAKRPMEAKRKIGGDLTQKMRAKLKRAGNVELEIVKRSDAAKGFTVLPKHWIVERTFGWLGRCRRLAKDFENLSRTQLAFVQLAMIRLMARRIARLSKKS